MPRRSLPALSECWGATEYFSDPKPNENGAGTDCRAESDNEVERAGWPAAFSMASPIAFTADAS